MTANEKHTNLYVPQAVLDAAVAEAFADLRSARDLMKHFKIGNATLYRWMGLFDDFPQPKVMFRSWSLEEMKDFVKSKQSFLRSQSDIRPPD